MLCDSVYFLINFLRKIYDRDNVFFFVEKDNMLMNSCFIKVMNSNEKTMESRLISEWGLI